MKDTWVLSIKTSLPLVCKNRRDLKTSIYTFESFAEARAALRKVLYRYAFSENSMFDGKGNIVYLRKYIEKFTLDEENFDFSDDFLTIKKLRAVEDAIRNIFDGKDIVPEFEEGFFSDCMIAYTYENGEINFRGDDDGPYNGYNPVLRTNMFSMFDESDYFLYIDDLFGQNEATSELYIDLVKANEFDENGL